ncbi:glutamine synthetase III [Oceanivirga miroungae]|uniref:Glutamine synthetase n=1 Tax=Oceanivirga miroungae TaxID=1130046 RepID=A0A6I8M5B0_9FUSO|nr:glutamine synthetase III [Oceanivirga miroungae]VWL85108.1 glutamine synthetase [Oceanivirga miroungae]
MKNIMEVFGVNTFTDSNLRKRVPKKVFEDFKRVQNGEIELSKENADIIANAIKDWATKRNATHFCHWFHPLTDLTAEKHDSFIEPTGDKDIIYRFSGSNLIKGESDASSFPNGGLRSTFEARGYTIWDVNSPPFIRENEIGTTLYIPTAFISFNGEALDKKIPLLRSIDAINKSSVRLLNNLGYDNITCVKPTLGVEQEYFLVKKEYFDKRVDLMFTGRTLFGAKPTKNQENSFHYYGKIKDNVLNFMAKLDYELWKFGIPAKTRHNEVAPNQFEIASIYEIANLSADQNQIIMETIEKLAIKDGFVALLHEKPFSYVNGSGKHNNWSLTTNENKNLLDPKSPTFLIFLLAVVEAVNRYYKLLRAVIATASNDLRLGGHEAPPAIISVFLGNHLTNKLENASISVVDNKIVCNGYTKNKLENVNMINISRDYDDRNRTSPFAFTGNKFEFRMPGSMGTPANCATMINTMISKVLNEYSDRLEKSSDKVVEMNNIMKESFDKHKRIIFNGDGYSQNWYEEAKNRGLENIRTTDVALKAYIDKENIKLLEDENVLTELECSSRYNAYMSRYIEDRLTEVKTLSYMVDKNIFSYAYKYLPSVLLDKQKDEILKILNKLYDKNNEMKTLIEEIEKTDVETKASLLSKKAFEMQTEIRTIVDSLENIIPSSIWDIPTYVELLYKL